MSVVFEGRRKGDNGQVEVDQSPGHQVFDCTPVAERSTPEQLQAWDHKRQWKFEYLFEVKR